MIYHGLLLTLLVCICSGHAVDKRYEGSEHKYIGNTGTLRILDLTTDPTGATPQDISPSSYTFVNEAGVTLGNYGDLVGLSGDFFGPLTLSKVVCFPTDDSVATDNFMAAFNSLWQSTDSAYIGRVEAQFKIEMDAVDNRAAGQAPWQSFAALPINRWGDVYPSTTVYASLVLNNFDHFGSCATRAYRIGHTAAMSAAVAASGLLASNATQAESALIRAYAMDAFASHYLTDNFAAGHVRTPRNDLRVVCLDASDDHDVSALAAGGLASLWQHDEDNRNGLFVTNARGDYFETFGDDNYFDDRNAVSRNMSSAAVQASRDEVFAAFKSGQVSTTFNAVQYVPDPSSVQDPYSVNNTCPMFYTDANGQVQIRQEGSLRPEAWRVARNLTGGCSYAPFTKSKCTPLFAGTIFQQAGEQLEKFWGSQPTALTFSNQEQAWVSNRPDAIDGSSANRVVAASMAIFVAIACLLL